MGRNGRLGKMERRSVIRKKGKGMRRNEYRNEEE